eukprot:scaffold1361_cov165-Amphora_coffeaeformis.AAC.8
MKPSLSSQENTALKHKRRFCKINGCERIVKSQGLCQRHGAKPRKCKMEGCSKQAQGNFDGMCKSHFKASKADPNPTSGQDKEIAKSQPPPPSGDSVYDRIIPHSIAWCPRVGTPMPLIAHLKAGFDAGKPLAWHRNEERRARGMWPVTSPATQLEGWERELVWTEILILTGNSQTSFRHLARAWGRDKGFQTVLAQFICERKGITERKPKVRPLGQLPSCVEITHSSNINNAGANGEQFHEEGTSGSASVASAEGAGFEAWGESYYDEFKNQNQMNRNEELAADLFQFQQPARQQQQQNRFASFEFDSAMLAEMDRDAEAIISSSDDEEEERDQKRQAV